MRSARCSMPVPARKMVYARLSHRCFSAKAKARKTRLSLTSDARKSMPQAICKGPAISTG